MGAINALHVSAAAVAEYSDISVDLIYADPNQPRKEFREDELAELASTIKEFGLIQPISVRKDGNGKFIILAGERRFRAVSQVLGMPTIKAVVKEMSAEQVPYAQLIENMQREDLGPVAEGLAIEKIIADEGIQAKDLAVRLGKSPSYISSVRAIAKAEDVANGYCEAKVGTWRVWSLAYPEIKEKARQIARERGKPIRQNEIRLMQEAEKARRQEALSAEELALAAELDAPRIESNRDIEDDLDDDLDAPVPLDTVKTAPVAAFRTPSPRSDSDADADSDFAPVDAGVSDKSDIDISQMLRTDSRIDLEIGTPPPIDTDTVKFEAGSSAGGKSYTLTKMQLAEVADIVSIDAKELMKAVKKVLG